MPLFYYMVHITEKGGNRNQRRKKEKIGKWKLVLMNVLQKATITQLKALGLGRPDEGKAAHVMRL